MNTASNPASSRRETSSSLLGPSIPSFPPITIGSCAISGSWRTAPASRVPSIRPCPFTVLITIALGRHSRAASTSSASGTHGPRFTTSWPFSSSNSCRNIRFQVWESEEVVDNRIRWRAGPPSAAVRSAVVGSVLGRVSSAVETAGGVSANNGISRHRWWPGGEFGGR